MFSLARPVFWSPAASGCGDADHDPACEAAVCASVCRIARHRTRIRPCSYVSVLKCRTLLARSCWPESRLGSHGACCFFKAPICNQICFVVALLRLRSAMQKNTSLPFQHQRRSRDVLSSFIFTTRRRNLGSLRTSYEAPKFPEQLKTWKSPTREHPRSILIKVQTRTGKQCFFLYSEIKLSKKY